MIKRQLPEVRRDQILQAAMAIAIESGYDSITRDGVAERACVATGQVNRIFTSMQKLRNAVIRCAVNTENLPIIAAGLAEYNSIAREAPEWLKRKALDTLIES